MSTETVGPTDVLVVAPHPDDESLGCGGALLRHRAQGHSVCWLIVTDASEKNGYSADFARRRKSEIADVAAAYGFAAVYNLGYPPTRLDTVPRAELIGAIGKVVSAVAPHTVYLPFRGDAHTDHELVFDSVAACTKWFRFPSIRRVLSYETLSETDCALQMQTSAFAPNYFIDISQNLSRKLEIVQTYASELGGFPFPRSIAAMRALAAVRGAASGCNAAEAFMLLKEIVRD